MIFIHFVGKFNISVCVLGIYVSLYTGNHIRKCKKSHAPHYVLRGSLHSKCIPSITGNYIHKCSFGAIVNRKIVILQVMYRMFIHIKLYFMLCEHYLIWCIVSQLIIG